MKKIHGVKQQAIQVDIGPPATSRASVSHNHDRRGSGAVSASPALPNVRALGFLANGCQSELSHRRPEPVVVLTLGRDCLEPAGFAMDHLCVLSRRGGQS